MKETEKKFRRFLNQLSYKLLGSFLSVSFLMLLLSIYEIDTLKQIEIGNIAAWAKTIESLAAPVLSFCQNIFVKIIIWIVFCSVLLLLIFKRILRPKAIVIAHSTFSNTQSTYDNRIVSGMNIKQKDINLVELSHNIVDAVRTQDRLIKSVLRECDEFTELFYYGIAHIPLIFRAGFQIGDEGKVRLLHKHRNEQSVFKEISSEPDDFRIYLEGNYDQWDSNSKEMLVTIATSFPIQSEDLSVFRSNNKIGSVFSFEMKNQAMYGVDSVVSYAVMNRLRTEILKIIRNFVATENLEKIHLVLATSSDFTFFLSQGFSKYHDPEIIVYQYERSNPQKYPWGISNKALPASAIIQHK